MTYDPLQPDAYAEHLGAVNATNDVVIAEDIRNASGMLIAKKGQHVSHETVQKIIQFKLIKPLEESIDIADGLTPDKIIEDIRGLFKDDGSRELHERYQQGAEIRRATKFLERFPILRQKLTVLAMQMPHEYQKSLMVSWYALLIARKLNFSLSDRDELFLASLTHDIGMLHIDRSITGKQGQLSAEEWRTIQGHVAISNVIVSQTPGMPPAPASAVLEHHEIADGTGYLSGRRGDELSVMGQIVGVADAMCALLLKWKSLGREARDLIPILRINSYVYHRGVCAAYIQVLRELNFRETGLLGDSEIDAVSTAMLRGRKSLSDYADAIKALMDGLSVESHARRSVQSANTVYAHISNTIHASGVLNDGYVPWLKSVVSNRQKNHYREVEDTGLMLDEVRFQLLKVTRLLHAVAEDKNAMTAEEHHAFLGKLNALPTLPSG